MDAFTQYQRIPQYIVENRGMTLDGFKGIFWWEWTHRFLGRLLGVLFIVPFLWFAWKGAIKKSEWPRMLLLFALAGINLLLFYGTAYGAVKTVPPGGSAPFRARIMTGVSLCSWTAVIVCARILTWFRPVHFG